MQIAFAVNSIALRGLSDGCRHTNPLHYHNIEVGSALQQQQVHYWLHNPHLVDDVVKMGANHVSVAIVKKQLAQQIMLTKAATRLKSRRVDLSSDTLVDFGGWV